MILRIAHALNLRLVFQQLLSKFPSASKEA